MSSASSSQLALRKAIQEVLGPLASIALREGLSVGDIRGILENVMVRRAEEYLLSIGKKPTYSSIAVITGLTRNAVRAVLEAAEHEVSRRAEQGVDRARRVLSAWHEDPEFLDRTGRPAVLRIRGARTTFETLALRYGGGVPYSPLLQRLLETKSVRVTRRDKDGRPTFVRAVRATFRSDPADKDVYQLLGQIIGDGVEAFDSKLRGTVPANRVEPQTFSTLVIDDGESLQRTLRTLRLRSESTVAALDRAIGNRAPSLRSGRQEDCCEQAYEVRISVLATVRRSVSEKPDLRRAWRRRKPA